MNFSNFLLFDVALLVIAIPILFILQGDKDTWHLFGKSDDNKNTVRPSTIPTTINEILQLEALTKNQGSGIDADSLIGLWKFDSVWDQDNDSKSSTFSSLLRLFSASLEIGECQISRQHLGLDITNSIKFGSLAIQFVGLGELQGKQPLLSFYFERIKLTIGKRVLINRALETPDKKDRPFFALIGIEEHGSWLAARGRGGGLAVWQKAQPLI